MEPLRKQPDLGLTAKTQRIMIKKLKGMILVYIQVHTFSYST